MNEALRKADDTLAYLLDGIKSIESENKHLNINILVVSDHGMGTVTKTFYIDDVLDVNLLEWKELDAGTMVYLFPKTQENRTNIYKTLLLVVNGTLNMNDVPFDVYLKENIPKHWYFSIDPAIPPIVVVAKPSWVIQLRSRPYTVKGMHGYPLPNTEMHAIFIAKGKYFYDKYIKSNVTLLSSFHAVDIFPLMLDILEISKLNRTIS